MEQPKGFDLAEGKYFVCKLKKALCGLKQTPRGWYARLDHYIQQQGFKKGFAGSNLYMKVDKDKLLITLIYVDDLIFGSNNDEMSHIFAQNISKEFEMSMIGQLSYCLEVHVTQTKAGCKLSKDDESPMVDATIYRSMIRGILYLTASRVDIMQAIEMVARFQSAPKESHMLVVKRILR
eukprot:PITA_05159